MAAKAPPAKGKKLPKWALIAGGVGIVGVVYYVKKNKESTEGNATAPADQGLTSQAFIPVTGENVGGVGAGGGGSVGGESGTSALLGLVTEENKQNQEFQREQNTALREYLASSTAETQRNFQETLKGLTGGGAPSTGQSTGASTEQSSGAGTASPPSGGTPAAPPAPPAAPPAPPKQPAYHSVKCPNGCEGHYYSPSHIECQTKVKGKCTWPS